MNPKTLLTLTFLLSAASAVLPASSAATGVHFELEKSAPEEGASVHAISEVRLWFTQAPQDATTSIRVLNAEGEPVPTGDVTQDASDGKVFSVSLADGLAPGPYTVAWRAMGTDGHVVRGNLSFTVVAH